MQSWESSEVVGGPPARQGGGPVYTGVDPTTEIQARGADRQDVQTAEQIRQNQIGNAYEGQRVGLAADDNALARERLGTEKADKPRQKAGELRNEYRSEPSIKEYNTVIRSFATGLTTAPDANGDQTLIVSYAKMLDPNSVVRESEFDVAASNENWLARNSALLAKEFGYDPLSGRMTDAGRRKMRNEMQNISVGYVRKYDQDRNYYSELARRQGLDPFDVVGEHAGAAFLPTLRAYDEKQNRDPEMVGVTTGERMDMETTEEDNRYYFQRANGLTYDQEVAFSDWLNSNVGRPLTAEQIDAKKAELEIPPTAKLKDSGAIAQEHMTVGVPDANGAVRTANWGKRSLEGAREAAIAEKNRELAAQEQALADGGYAASQEAQRNADAFDRGGLEGFSLNYADDIVGAFNQNAGREMRLSSDVYDETAGGYKIAGEIGGSMLLPFKGGSAAKVAKQAAAYGAASGIGRGETTGERLQGGLIGGALGGAGGFATQKLIDKVAPPVAKWVDDWAVSRAARREPMKAQGREYGEAVNQLDAPFMAAQVPGATGNQLATAITSKTLGGVPIVNRARKIAEEIDAIRTDRIGRIGNAGNNKVAGDAVRRGMDAWETTARDRAGKLWESIPISSSTPSFIKNSQGALREINSPAQSNVALAELMRNPKMVAYEGALKKGGLDWGDLRSFRSYVGELRGKMLGQDDIAEGALKNLYGALTRDVEETAGRVGPAALKSFRRANDYTRGVEQRVEAVTKKLFGKKGDGSDEAGWARLNRWAQENNGDFKSLRRAIGSMPPEESQVVRASFANNLGMDTAAGASQFSPGKFATEWGKLSEGAKSVLFHGEHRKNLDALATIFNAEKDGRQFTNFSNTSVGTFAAANLAGIAANPIAGLAAAATQFGGGALLSSPAYARWVLSFTKKPNPPAALAHIEKLSAIAKAEPFIADNVIDMQKFLAEQFARSPSSVAAQGENADNGGQIPPNQAKLYDESQNTQGGRIQ